MLAVVDLVEKMHKFCELSMPICSYLYGNPYTFKHCNQFSLLIFIPSGILQKLESVSRYGQRTSQKLSENSWFSALVFYSFNLWLEGMLFTYTTGKVNEREIFSLKWERSIINIKCWVLYLWHKCQNNSKTKVFL